MVIILLRTTQVEYAQSYTWPLDYDRILRGKPWIYVEKFHHRISAHFSPLPTVYDVVILALGSNVVNFQTQNIFI